MTTTTFSHPVVEDWLQQLSSFHDDLRNDAPSYYASDASSLITSSIPTEFVLGTGEQVLSSAFRIALTATQEVLLVTCFWAHSPSQELVSQLLHTLSIRATRSNRIIRVRICLSSLSIKQKLFQTASVNGKVWSASTWQDTFGLPSLEDLPGLDLKIKSVFVRPFSVLHPKFLVVDRKVAWVPSCNVSWEKWFEGGVRVEGGIVEKLCRFFEGVWEPLPRLDIVSATAGLSRVGDESSYTEKGLLVFKKLDLPPIPTVLLPSPHHQKPHFRPWPLRSQPPPATPLNILLLTLLAHAKKDIYIQTPNVTASPVIKALLEALGRGIDVTIITSSKMMVLEQLGTAGTVTELSIRNLRCKYERMREKRQLRGDDEEALHSSVNIGNLDIHWYKARSEPHGQRGALQRADNEPVKSHFKCTIVDGEITVLGSGNMDRASWYTSQELGVAFFSAEFADAVREGASKGLVGRLRR